MARLFVLAPFGKSSWQVVDTPGEAARVIYWRQVTPDWIQNSNVESSEGVERLLRRPGARVGGETPRVGQGAPDLTPFVAARFLVVVAKTYEQEATHQDTQAGIRHRLR